MRRYCEHASRVEPAPKMSCFPGAQGFNGPEGHGGVSRDRVREPTPGVVFGRGAHERTAQKPGRVSLFLETIRQINGAPATNPPYTARVRGCPGAVAKNGAPHRGRPKARGTIAEADEGETSEGRIRAMKAGKPGGIPGAGRAKPEFEKRAVL